MKVDDDIFLGKASLLTQAGQHVFDELAITCGRQGGATVRQVNTAVTTLQP